MISYWYNWKQPWNGAVYRLRTPLRPLHFPSIKIQGPSAKWLFPRISVFGPRLAFPSTWLWRLGHSLCQSVGLCLRLSSRLWHQQCQMGIQQLSCRSPCSASDSFGASDDVTSFASTLPNPIASSRRCSHLSSNRWQTTWEYFKAFARLLVFKANTMRCLPWQCYSCLVIRLEK